MDWYLLTPFLLFGFVFLMLLAGFPVGFTLAGSSLIFAGVGFYFDVFVPSFVTALPERLYGILTN